MRPHAPFICSTKTDHVHQLLGHDYIDVWRMGADGTVDLRMHTDLFVQISPTVPECSVLVENLEAFVREAETHMVKTESEASWFEEYVSSLYTCSYTKKN